MNLVRASADRWLCTGFEQFDRFWAGRPIFADNPTAFLPEISHRAWEDDGRQPGGMLHVLPFFAQGGYGNTDHDMDGVPSRLLACWDVVRTTGDMDLLKRWLPLLEQQAAAWKRHDVDGNGLFEASVSGNAGDWHGWVNIWDQVNFGHEDAYSLALGYHGLRRPGRPGTFWPNGPSKPRSTTPTPPSCERRTSRLFSIPRRESSPAGEAETASCTTIGSPLSTEAAITYGLVDVELANQIMDRFQAKLKEVGYTRFDLGLPWSLVPIAKKDYSARATTRLWGGSEKEDGSDGFQYWCNGSALPLSGFYIQALYQLGTSPGS